MRSLLLLGLLAPGCTWISKDQLCEDEPTLPECDEGDDSAPLDADGDGVAADLDCDDGDASRYPGSEERCDGVDQDCDEEVDEGVTATWYTDADEDGYAGSPVEACEAPEGASTEGSDCDDADAAVNPGATETCGGGDEDCDGETDEAGAQGELTWYADADEDGYGDPDTTATSCAAPEGYVAGGEDCDDLNASRTETCPEPWSEDFAVAQGVLDDGVIAILGLESGDQTGVDVDVGDWDNDEVLEIIVGIPNRDGSQINDATGSVTEFSSSGGAALLQAPTSFTVEDQSVDEADVEIIANPLRSYGGNDLLGSQVRWVGSLDGDTYGEYAISAPGWNLYSGGTDVGAVLLYEGPTGDSETTIFGVDSGAYFGSSLAAGSFTAATSRNLVVGAPNYSDVKSYQGEVLLFGDPIGADSYSSDAELTITGTSEDYGVGGAVANADDTDGDGLEDLLVGAYCSPRSSDVACPGKAYLFRDLDLSTSSASLTTTDADVALHGVAATSTDHQYVGGLVLGVGDLNADGHPDLVVGAGFDDSGDSLSGANYVLSGDISESGPIEDLASTKLVGQREGAVLGFCQRGAAAAGDVDGDGFGDVWLGETQDPYSSGTSAVGEGRVYLVAGAPDLASISDLDEPRLVISGESEGDQFGMSIASAGDVNGDGCDDLLVGSPHIDSSGTAGATGVAWLISGCTSP